MAKQPSCMCFRRAGNSMFNVRGYVRDLAPVIGSLTGPGIKASHGQATCVLLHKTLLLTTNVTLSERDAAFDTEVSLKYNGSIIRRHLDPRRLFITDHEHDLTLVACEEVSSDLTPLPMDTSRAYGRSYKAGRVVYILGHSRNDKQNDPVTLGKGKVVAPHSDDKVIKFLVKDQDFWVPGSAGFDSWGNFAFLVCSPKGWLPKDSKAKKKRFSFMPKDRRTKLTQTGLTIHSIKEWMEKVLSDREHGSNDTGAAGSGAHDNDLRALQEVVRGI